MPDRESFVDTECSSATENYYSTLFHELTHWTGAKHRLDRQFGKRFGDNAYAFEELVAELGAAFNCATLGITSTPRADHAQYIENWLQVLKGDKRAIFHAASKAAQSVDYLQAFCKRWTMANNPQQRKGLIIAHASGISRRINNENRNNRGF
jgi:antirestriction protein ArdC